MILEAKIFPRQKQDGENLSNIVLQFVRLSGFQQDDVFLWNHFSRHVRLQS